MRRRIAIGLLCVWGLGIELAPCVHLAIHELLEHHHHAGDHPDEDTDSQEHGRYSVEHKQLAWLQPDAPPVPPQPMPTPGFALPETATDLHRSNVPAVVRSRGPPRA